MSLMRPSLLAALAAATVLTACGGGDGGTGFQEPASPESLRAEGGWVGSLTGGTYSSVHVLVLDNDQAWAIYGTDVPSSSTTTPPPPPLLAIHGFVQANGVSKNGVYTATDAKDFGIAAPTDTTVAIKYVQGAYIKGVDGAVSLDAMPWALDVEDSTAVPVYDYDTAAAQTDVSGSWVVRGSDGDDYTLAIGTQGTLSGYSSGCAVTGAMTPRLSGKNAFDLTLQFGAAPCKNPNVTFTGVAYLEPHQLTIGTNTVAGNQLIGVGVNADRTKGFAITAAYSSDRTQGITVLNSF